jgi:hypothetical protein
MPLVLSKSGVRLPADAGRSGEVVLSLIARAVAIAAESLTLVVFHRRHLRPRVFAEAGVRLFSVAVATTQKGRRKRPQGRAGQHRRRGRGRK